MSSIARAAGLSLVAGLALLACGEPPVDRAGPSRDLASTATDAGAASSGVAGGAPTVLFEGAPTWTYGASAPLVPGTAETLHYDLSRLAQCQGDGGWTLTAYLSADGAAATALSVSAAQLAPGATSVDLPFEVPFAQDLAFWFELQGGSCQAWDSNYGNNFHFAIAEPTTPVVHFAADFTQSVQGTLVAGRPLTVDYALARLPACRGTEGANPGWSVTLFAAVDGVSLPSMEIVTVLLGQGIGAPAVITPPAGAHSLSFWFENDDVDGCNQWDSSYGQNFTFGLE